MSSSCEGKCGVYKERLPSGIDFDFYTEDCCCHNFSVMLAAVVAVLSFLTKFESFLI